MEQEMDIEADNTDIQQPQNLDQTDKNCVKRVANNLLQSEGLFTPEEKKEFSRLDNGRYKPIQTKAEWNAISVETKNKMTRYALVSLLADVHSSKIREPFSMQNIASYNQLFGGLQY